MPRRAVAVAVSVSLLAIASASPAQAGEVLAMAAGPVFLVEPAEQDDDLMVGPSVSIAFLEVKYGTWRLESGFELQGTMLFGKGERWYADGWLAFVATLKLTEGWANPFVALGPTVGGFGRTDGANGVSLGVRGDAGLHGVLGSAFWRACVGVLGPGVGGVRSELSVGYAFH